jgi:phosphatidylserine decarboxylase
MSRLPLDAAGLPFIGGALAMALLSALLVSSWLALIFVLLAAFFVFFFRDPDRRIVASGDEVLAPADGRVLVAGPADTAASPPGSWKQVSIFLSPMDVHVNRVPVSGRVTRRAYQRGRFLPAYHQDAAATNERCEIWIDHGGQFVVARQIVGILARRVVCRTAVGAVVAAGDRYGIMKFGSRMDIFVPTTADIRVQIGETVRAGETVIAVLH